MNHLSVDEQEIAAALAKAIEVELRFDSKLYQASPHVGSAALTAKLLITAADAFRGTKESFLRMAETAFDIIHGDDGGANQ